MKEVLLSLARASIKSHFLGSDVDTSQIEEEYPELMKEGASFVTLTQEGQLRGCIGSIIAHRSLLDDVLANARSAAFKDPRFMPLSEEELARTKIEVSVLTTPKLLEYEDVDDLKTKIQVGVDGIILKDGYHQATFLPQVWEELNDLDLFFAHLCQKAGLGTRCLESHPEIAVYQVEKIQEN
ncbi:AmmeMemoRadiSam system protein A [Campylobacterota bacterium]